MKRIAVVLFLSLAMGCAGSKPAYAPPAAATTSSRLVSITSAELVREVFNASSDRIRVVTLLSPT